MDFEAGIADDADSDRVGKALEEGKVDMAVEPFCLEAGEAVGDRLEGCAYGVEMAEPLPQAEVVEVVWLGFRAVSERIESREGFPNRL